MYSYVYLHVSERKGRRVSQCAGETYRIFIREHPLPFVTLRTRHCNGSLKNEQLELKDRCRGERTKVSDGGVEESNKRKDEVEREREREKERERERERDETEGEGEAGRDGGGRGSCVKALW